MEPLAHPHKAPAAVVIAAPTTSDGIGTALRRTFNAPGALPQDMLKLLRRLEDESQSG
jgi:hypothetical protein